MSLFQKAQKNQVKLRLALVGPSGSGKTYSALLIAKRLVAGGKIAVVDTENRSASLYADRFDFDVAAMNPPYSVDKYLKAMRACEEAGYDCLIIDSLSHAWFAPGGVLDQKSKLDSKGGNSFVNWSKITPIQEKLKDAVLHPKYHLICTMRTKQDYVIEADDRGKSVPRKVGLAPIQREGMEYEFDVVLDINMSHTAVASKDRTGLFSSEMPFNVDKDVGDKLVAWMKDSKAEKTQTSDEINETPEKKTEGITASTADQQIGEPELKVAAQARQWRICDVELECKKQFGVEISQMTSGQFRLAHEFFSNNDPPEEELAASQKQIRALYAIAAKQGMSGDDLRTVIKKEYKLTHLSDILKWPDYDNARRRLERGEFTKEQT